MNKLAKAEIKIIDLEIDTEYTHVSDPVNHQDFYCRNITAQCREINQTTGIIYGHPDIASESRHKVFKYDFVGWDYLEDLGHLIEPLEQRSEDISNLPVLQINIYAFFAIAELCRIFQGQYLKDITELLQHPRKNKGIKQGRRLITYTQQGRKYYDSLIMPWFVKLDGLIYHVSICFLDTGAIHGKTSYSEFCHNSGIQLKYKDNFTKEEKARMFEMYQERPEDFDNYALGDLYNHEALQGNEKAFREIYKSLGLEDYFTPPKLTIGSTVAKMFEAAINKLFSGKYGEKKVINKFCQYGSADKLKRENTTACLLAKVDGGRCRNNRPIETVHNGILCDIDISGCYGEGLRTQIYPLGIPCILDYPKGSEHNKFLTLRKFLKKYDSEFIPGLWTARVSLKDDYQLKYKQDYLMSWLPPNNISSMVTDSDLESTDQWWDIDNIGIIKIFKNEIHNAVITHDFIQWLDNVATPRQRKELLDNLLVYSAAWYPKSLRVDTIDELVLRHDNYKPKNTTEIKTKGKKRIKVSIQDMCHSWYGVNLGELLIDKLLIERKKHPKKTPLNNLFKLCTNTVYGDMVSPYFKVGNVVVGNNITARARALAWCMEKGFNGWQTITDGCTFDLSRVSLNRDGEKLTGENTVEIYTGSYSNKITTKNLTLETYNKYTNNHQVEVSKSEFMTVSHRMDAKCCEYLKEDYNKLISEAAYDHLRNLFPGLDVLHMPSKDVYGQPRIGQFSFEVKGIFHNGTFHGSANYSLTHQDTKVAMRSYSKTPKSVVTLEDGLSYEDTKIQPAKEFLLSLNNPYGVPRSKVFIDERILKINDYRNQADTYYNSRVLPGNTVYNPRILREFSLSQFTFNTYQQYKNWKQEYERHLRRYAQSYEMFFINEDGTLNYQQMIEEIELAIREDKKRFSDTVRGKNRNLNRYYSDHGAKDCLDETRKAIERLYKVYEANRMSDLAELKEEEDSSLLKQVTNQLSEAETLYNKVLNKNSDYIDSLIGLAKVQKRKAKVSNELGENSECLKKAISILNKLPQNTALTEQEFSELLAQHLEQLNSGYRSRVQEAAAIAFYHQQIDWPVVRTLVCDDARQFKLLTEELALCWVHEGRHYKKLNPLVVYHQKLLEQFLTDFWDYYRELLAYREAPSLQAAEQLRGEFYQLFESDTGYQQLDERKRLTAAKISELLLVLEHPELPLHNNPAELGARTMVQRRNISYATQTLEGTKAWDIFMSLVATTRKLGISFFEYMRDRISQLGNIPSLGTLIREQSSLYSFDGSWNPE